MRLGAQVAIAMVGVGLLAVAAESIASYQLAREALKDTVLKGAEAESVQRAHRIEERVEGMLRFAHRQARLSIMEDVIAEDVDGRISAHLTTLKSESMELGGLWLLDARGVQVASSGCVDCQTSLPVDAVSEGSILRVRPDGTHVPLISATVFEPEMPPDFEGEPPPPPVALGVLYFRFADDWLQGQIQGGEATSRLIWSQGQVVAAFGYSGLGELQAEQGVIDSPEGAWLCGRGLIEIPGGRQWYLQQCQLGRAVLQPIAELGKRAILVGLAILLFAVITGLVLAHRVVAPIRLIAEGTERIRSELMGTGGIGPAHGLPVERTDEIGLFARSFVAMVDELQASAPGKLG